MLLKVQREINFLGFIFAGQQPLYYLTSQRARETFPFHIFPLPLPLRPPDPTPRLIVPVLPGDGHDLGPGVAPRYTQRDVRTVRDL
jgi:hypothetical protein